MELAWLPTHSFTSFWLAFCWVSSVSWACIPEDRPKAGLQQPVLGLSKGVVSCYSWSCLLVGCLISFPLPVRVAEECISCCCASCLCSQSDVFQILSFYRKVWKHSLSFAVYYNKNLRTSHHLKVQRFCHLNWNFDYIFASKWVVWCPTLKGSTQDS